MASCICLLGFSTGCNDSADQLVGRWELVAINDMPVAEAPPIRLGTSREHDRGWIEEKLVSRVLEISQEEWEFFDRSVVRIRIRRGSPVDTVGGTVAPPIVRTEVTDTLLLTGTLEIEEDSIGFRPSPVAGRIQHSRSNDSSAATQGFRGAMRVGPLGADVPYILVGIREGHILRMRGPDGTMFTFERDRGTP